MSATFVLKGFRGRVVPPPADQAVLLFSSTDGREMAIHFPRSRLSRVALGLLQLLGDLSEQSRSGTRDQTRRVEAVLKASKFGASVSENGTPILEIQPEKGPRLHFEIDENRLEGLEESLRQTRLALQGRKPVLQ